MRAVDEDAGGDEGGRPDVGRALESLSDGDLLRLRALARLRARGLPGVEWADLLNETVARALAGSRRWPAGVPLVAFLAGAMRSVCDQHWRRVRLERRVLAPVGPAEDAPEAVADPERIAAAVQALARLDALFARDGAALAILAGLAAGLSPAEIRVRNGLSETAYDSARRRMRRVLLREGLGGWR